MAGELDVRNPWTHPAAAKWDSEMFASWIDRKATLGGDDVRMAFTRFANAVLRVEPSEVSLLYVLAYIAGARNETVKGTLQRWDLEEFSRGGPVGLCLEGACRQDSFCRDRDLAVLAGVYG